MPVYHAVWVHPRKRGHLHWSEECATVKWAQRLGAAAVRDGLCIVAFVVATEPGNRRRVLAGWTVPERARDVLSHYSLVQRGL